LETRTAAANSLRAFGHCTSTSGLALVSFVRSVVELLRAQVVMLERQKDDDFSFDFTTLTYFA
jgi:hypothetical protein